MTQYVSTRGGLPQGFTDVLLSGMAPDGGLYVPQSLPRLAPDDLRGLRGLDYAALAAAVIRPFTGADVADDALRALLADAYAPPSFSHKAVAPLVQAGPNLWIMELFHGPTLSFKDYAMQFLGRLFDHVLEQKKQRITIVGATSGDTGSAAIEACKGCRNVDIFILHPKGRTSEVQRRQMTTVDAPNVHNIALEGTFDDCQTIVKALFADETLRADLALSAVNSINWARIMAQSVYYFAAALALGAPERAVSFTVPTGNFGNVYAAHTARRMGLPIQRLGIATNRNDILTRFFETGAMRLETVTPSLSPSMDIQISSNFERYLFDLLERDAPRLNGFMKAFRETGAFALDETLMKKARNDFTARRCSDPQTLETMRTCYGETGLLIDPHTAVALHGAAQIMEDDPRTPMVVLACAHPAKFPDAVRQATGCAPPPAPRLAALTDREERYAVLPDDLEAVKIFIKTRAGR